MLGELLKNELERVFESFTHPEMWLVVLFQLIPFLLAFLMDPSFIVIGLWEFVLLPVIVIGLSSTEASSVSWPKGQLSPTPFQTYFIERFRVVLWALPFLWLAFVWPFWRLADAGLNSGIILFWYFFGLMVFIVEWSNFFLVLSTQSQGEDKIKAIKHWGIIIVTYVCSKFAIGGAAQALFSSEGSKYFLLSGTLKSIFLSHGVPELTFLFFLVITVTLVYLNMRYMHVASFSN